MKPNNPILDSYTFQNGNIISLSNTNINNKEFELFKAKFDTVSREQPKCLQEFLNLLAAD